MHHWHRRIRQAFTAAMLIGPVLTDAAESDKARGFDPSQLVKPSVCPTLFKLNAKGLCEVQAGQVQALKTTETCQPNTLFTLDTAKGECKAKQDTVAPECKAVEGFNAKIEQAGVDAKCIYSPAIDVESSNSGDYLGDCFIIKSKVQGYPDLAPDSAYIVTRQDNSNPDKPMVKVVPAQRWDKLSFFQEYVPGMSCRPSNTSSVAPLDLPARSLTDAGALRMGWVHGVLTMPYKYYPSKKKFEAGVPLGAYLGWRWGQPGAGLTLAAAVTIGSVKANTVDPKTLDADGKPKVTGNTNATALAAALGYVVDITRNEQRNPFKVGVFVGKDFVNTSPNLVYEYNRKTWVALQIGFQFTDYR
jgi:hypothetical protein